MGPAINEACDLNAISVLPPHSRRAFASSSGADSSSLRMSQHSLLRSQSQHSQGMALSQLSQTSFDEILMNGQRLGSEDQSSKRMSFLGPITCTREESLQLTQPANSIVRKWYPGSASEQKHHVREVIEHGTGLIQNYLTRFGRISVSIQNDIMQVNKAVREVTIEMESVRQKIFVQDNSLQLILKGEEDIKANINKSLKCTTEQLKNETDHLKLQEVTSMLSALPDQIESQILGLKKEVCKTIVEEIRKMKTRLKHLNNDQQHRVGSLRKNFAATRSQNSQPAKTQVLFSPTTRGRNSMIPKVEKVYTKKQKSFPFIKKRPILEMKQEEKDFTMKIKSDKDIDMGLSCLLKKKGTGCISSFSPEVMQETMHILMKARRKRKFGTVVILD